MNFTKSVLIGTLCSSFAFGDVSTVKMTLNDKGQLAQTGLKKVTSQELRSQKESEMEQKWQSCASAAEKNFANPQLQAIRGWVLLSWIKCSTDWLNKTKDLKTLKRSLDVFDRNANLLVSQGAWKDKLKSASLTAKMLYVDAAFTQGVLTWKDLNLLNDWMDNLSNEQKAKYFYLAGELSLKEQKKPAAQQFFEQSLFLREIPAARLKLQSLVITPAKSVSTTAKPAEVNKEISEAEQALQRLKNSEKTGDYIGYIREVNFFLTLAPGHQEAEVILNRVPELYIKLREKAEFESVQEKYLEQMLEGNPFHIAAWSRILHRRGELKASLKLSQVLTSLWKGTSNSEVHYYIVGRAAAMTGDYDTAIKAFESYAQYFPAGENLQECHMRAGLAHYRLRDWNRATVQFEKVMALSTDKSGKYDLNARYWLVRSLQKNKSDRATSEIKSLIEKYPFSYYGLRLISEKENQSLVWPSASVPTKIEKTLYFLPAHKNTLERVKILSENGWTQEGYWESQTIPELPSADAKVLLASLLSESGILPPAIRFVNEATDLGENYRAFTILNLTFPSNYAKVIEKEAFKNQLNPILVKSLIRQESAFYPFATSSSNALGLMQMIPPTAQEIASDLKIMNLTLPDDLYVAENNIPMGSYYLAKVLKQVGGHVPLGLASYNAGPTRLKQFLELRNETKFLSQDLTSDVDSEIWFDELPWYETSFYVKAILRNTFIYKLLEKSPDKRRVLLPSVLWKDLIILPTES